MTDRAPLAADLLAAADWFDEQLRRSLVDDGYPSLTRNQSLVIARLSNGPHRPSRLASELGITRQSLSTLVRQLVDLDVVEVADDPDDGRATRIRLSSQGRRLFRSARQRLGLLEEQVATIVGERELEVVRDVLATRWWDEGTTG